MHKFPLPLTVYIFTSNWTLPYAHARLMTYDLPVQTELSAKIEKYIIQNKKIEKKIKWNGIVHHFYTKFTKRNYFLTGGGTFCVISVGKNRT